MNLLSQAPTRMDLAGGTVDIWPIYLFLPGAKTINLGIDLFAEARLSSDPTHAGGITIVSSDQGVEGRYGWNEIAQASEQKLTHPALELPVRLLRYFQNQKKLHHTFDPNEGLRLEMRAKSPAGAGLGGSSTLSVALISAFQTWARPLQAFHAQSEGDALIEVARDVETTLIGVPAGLQDYYGAMFGGLQSLDWGIHRHDRKHLPEHLLTELEQRLVLFYSGQSRNSGINNWALFKAFIDKDQKVRENFSQIVEATQQLETALLRNDWAGVSDAIKQEWAARKTLAVGITTPEMDQAFLVGQELCGAAGKICGAGGGGCFFMLMPSNDRELRERLIEQVTQTIPGVRSLPFHAVPHGVRVTQS